MGTGGGGLSSAVVEWILPEAILVRFAHRNNFQRVRLLSLVCVCVFQLWGKRRASRFIFFFIHGFSDLPTRAPAPFLCGTTDSFIRELMRSQQQQQQQQQQQRSGPKKGNHVFMASPTEVDLRGAEVGYVLGEGALCPTRDVRRVAYLEIWVDTDEDFSSCYLQKKNKSRKHHKTATQFKKNKK